MEQIWNVIIDSTAQVVAILLAAFFAYVLNYLRVFVADKLKMQTLALAIGQLGEAIGATVAELQQTLVDDLKAAAEDGKLDEDEIKMLSERLIAGTMDKLSEPAIECVKAAGIDIVAYIEQVAEAFIHNAKIAKS